MHTHVLRLALTALPVFLAQNAHAQQDSGGYYVTAFGGISALQGDSLIFDGGSASLSYDSGITLGGALGYDYEGRPYRAEIEFVYRSGDAGTFAPAIATEGDFASTIVMINGYYEFATTSGFTPYVGAGLGYVTEIDFDIDAGPNAGEYSARGGLAAQAIIGADYPLSEAFSVYADARYLSAGTVDLTSPSGTRLSTDYSTTDINLGVRFRF